MEREHEQLIIRYLDGDLDEASARELNEVLQEDPEFRKEFVAYTRQERVLRVLLESNKGDVLSKQVLDQLRAEKDGEDFVDKVQKRITGRNARVKKTRPPSSRRRRTVRLRQRSNAGNPWAMPLGIAAMLLIGVGLYASFSQKSQSPSVGFKIDDGPIRHETIADVIGIDGPDVSIIENGKKVPVRLSDEIRPDDIVSTGAKSGLRLRYADGTVVSFGEMSKATVHQSDVRSAKQLILDSGSLTADVRPQPEGSPLSVKTALALATVKGTILTVNANIADTRLEVRRGKVGFERLSDHANVLVTEGRYAIADASTVAFESKSLIPEAPVIPLRDAKAEDFLTKTFQPAKGPLVPYRLFVPQRYDKAQKCPVVIFLHGIGEKGTDNVKQLGNNANGAMVFTTAKNQENHPCFMLVPQSNSGWWIDYCDPLAQLIDGLSKEYSIDLDRVYVTGLSSGGSGTWEMLVREPNLVAAGVPVCGGADPSKASACVNIAIWNFHAADDPTMNVAGSRNMIAALRKIGGKPFYTEYPVGGHAISWINGYKEPGLVEWLFAQKRGREPSAPNPLPYSK